MSEAPQAEQVPVGPRPTPETLRDELTMPRAEPLIVVACNSLGMCGFFREDQIPEGYEIALLDKPVVQPGK